MMETATTKRPKILILATSACAYPGADSVGQNAGLLRLSQQVEGHSLCALAADARQLGETVHQMGHRRHTTDSLGHHRSPMSAESTEEIPGAVG